MGSDTACHGTGAFADVEEVRHDLSITFMKLGRNQSCYCGSGKKYKKCCMEKKLEIPPEVLKYFQRKMTEDQMLKQAGILIPLVHPVIFQGKGVRAFGSRIYHRPVDETFHVFLLSLLHDILGGEWWKEQNKLESQDKHFIALCYEKFEEWVRRNQVSSKRIGKTNIWSAIPDGYSKSLLLLAFDIVSLSHMQDLPTALLERLKSKDQYQGARYEIAIAAIFARLNCKVSFTDEKSRKKRCEFIATDESSGISIAVEAKSRHRQGVLHQAGIVPDLEKLLSIRTARRLFNDALEQNPKDTPYVIFVDVNSPLTPSIAVDNKQWVKDAKNIVGKKLKDLPAKEHPITIFFTNFSHHYQTKDEALQGESIGIFTSNFQHTLPNQEFVNTLVGAVTHYGFVPLVELEESSSETGIPSIYE